MIPSGIQITHGFFDTLKHNRLLKNELLGNGFVVVPLVLQDRELNYWFYTHFHPYAQRMIDALNKDSIAGLQELDTDFTLEAPAAVFNSEYRPTDMVEKPYPVSNLDFSLKGAYSVYNWELFYHIPMIIAMHLSKNGRYAEAQQWFHFIFDPTDDGTGKTPERFWKVKPFRSTEVHHIEAILKSLSGNADNELRAETLLAIDAWRKDPFRPFLVARHRQTAYMLKTFMAYLDNLIAWGDSLFRQDTRETIDEARQHYVLARNLLGPRPQLVPAKGSHRPKTYAQLRSKLDAFSNVQDELEANLAFDLTPIPANPGDDTRFGQLTSLGKSLYFCVPRNDKLLGYWETVDDRLFKIRNSLNLQGIFRQLPLFEPSIDPALLAHAASVGVDVSFVVTDLNQPLPLVRFAILAQKAAEICQEVKSLGSNLLSALEKEDNEALSIMRARHERVILGLAETVRYGQWQEAVKARESLEKSLQNAVERYIYYERLLGETVSELKPPKVDPLDENGLEQQSLITEETAIEPRALKVDISPALGELLGGLHLSTFETNELLLSSAAQTFQTSAFGIEMLRSIFAAIPNYSVYITPLGMGGSIAVGGEQLANVMTAISTGLRGTADMINFSANMTAKVGGYARREQDWAFQSNLATGEVNQIIKQLRATQIREAIAKKELDNHRQQIRNAEEIERFLTDDKNGKLTKQALYTWMKREVRGLYNQCFQFAFDVARKAERALQHELGNMELRYLQPGYQSGKEGLLAGEKLYLDIKRMEMAYQDLNAREYELTKSISLQQLDPFALLNLKANGSCEVEIPEAIFDMETPGHYFRRIKYVSISIPCVTGPFTNVTCTLTLLKSSIRKSLSQSSQYARNGDGEDPRFDDYYGNQQSIVTSGGQNDSGLFETNLRDERYLPFEGAGVISRWRIELPNHLRLFDYSTITDVILHFRYTAREGGKQFRDEASGALKTSLNTIIQNSVPTGLTRIMSLKHEFPTEWSKFIASKDDFRAKVRKEHFPYFVGVTGFTLNSVDIYRVQNGSIESLPIEKSVLDNLKSQLKNTDEFLVIFPEDGAIIVRDKNAEIYVSIQFSLSGT